MPRRDTSMSTALCTSMVAHALLSLFVMEMYVKQVGRIFLPSLWRRGEAVAVVMQAPPRALDEQHAAIGRADGTGYGSHDSPGDQTLHAREAPVDQPFLSRDPVGPGAINDTPTFAVALGGTDTVAEEGRPLTPFGPPQALAISAPRSRARIPSPSSADPAPMSESESDPFATIGSVRFRHGKMEARFGRAVKTVRPRFSLAAVGDRNSLAAATVLLKVRADATGKVTAVEILQSSGSNELDLPIVRAMYEFWIDPPKDKSGQPRADVMVWRIDLW